MIIIFTRLFDYRLPDYNTRLISRLSNYFTFKSKIYFKQKQATFLDGSYSIFPANLLFFTDMLALTWCRALMEDPVEDLAWSSRSLWYYQYCSCLCFWVWLGFMCGGDGGVEDDSLWEWTGQNAHLPQSTRALIYCANKTWSYSYLRILNHKFSIYRFGNDLKSGKHLRFS